MKNKQLKESLRNVPLFKHYDTFELEELAQFFNIKHIANTSKTTFE